MSAQQDAKLAPPAAAAAAHPKDQSMQHQDNMCLRDTAAIAAAAPAGSSHCSNSSSSAGTCAGRQVLVCRATADLVLALCSDWEDVDQATSKAQPAAAGAGLGAGSILAHMLPSRWGLAGSKQHGQQADIKAGEGALALVSVSAADLCTGWQRLVYISPHVAHTALAHATAAAALAPVPDPDWRIGTADARAVTGTIAAAPAGSSRRGSSDGSSAASSRVAGAVAKQGSASAQATALPGQAVDSMPCVMHVVRHGESLQRIASVCSLGVSDLLAANPDVKDADAVHHNDCIAVPLPAVFPRLYVVQPGDTLHSIARAHEVSVGRVLAKNPELTDPGRLQPGWVVALPGLKGDSQVDLPSDWLSEASLTADMPQQQAAWQLESAPAADGDAELTATLVMQRQQQDVGGRRQRTLAGTVSEPGQGAALCQVSGLPAAVSDPGPGVVGRGGHAQEPELLPAVGSGAFLFTVGSFSSVSARHSSIPAVHGTCSGRASLHKPPEQRPQQRPQAVGQRAGAKKTRTRMAQQQ
jgi:LysM repeat protein